MKIKKLLKKKVFHGREKLQLTLQLSINKVVWKKVERNREKSFQLKMKLAIFSLSYVRLSDQKRTREKESRKVGLANALELKYF